jgi:predicted nucleotide-binding protein (sugar kinase/HSP70/actin superfamily)
VAVDLLTKKVLQTRPYEKERGTTDEVYQASLKRVCEAIQAGDLTTTLRKSIAEFERVEVYEPGKRPLIGILGENFVRLNRFSNEDVVRKIECLGGEASLVPLREFFLYLNLVAKKASFRKRLFSNLLTIFLTEYYQKKDEHHLERLWKGNLRAEKEPRLHQILLNAKPYLDASFEGEAILSVGRTIEFRRSGASGIINIMPFTCMPGTIASILLKRCREEEGNIPVLDMAYDGQEQTNTLTRLEAFMYQAMEFQKRE